MALPFLLVFSTSQYSEDQHRKATLFSENRLKTAQASATHRQRRKNWGTSNPKKGWNWSFFSHTMKPYPQAWLIKSGFDRETPVVRIGVVQSDELEVWNDVLNGQQAMRENWNRKAGEKTPVWVFSNAPEVELFLNGRSLGKKSVVRPPKGDGAWRCARGEKIHAALFEVDWEPGELKAVGSNGVEHSIRTTGPAVGLKLRREEGGEQLAYVWIEAVDAKGLVVPDAATEVAVSVNGPGRLVALDDGDHYTDLLFNVDTKKMKEGYLLAIIRRMGEGEIVLAATDAKTGASVSCKLWSASADR